MSKNNGGPAFPCEIESMAWVEHEGISHPVGDPVRHPMQGMSLRDYFQSQQTAAWIIALGMRFKEQGASDDAMISYAVEYGKRTADAMLSAREAE